MHELPSNLSLTISRRASASSRPSPGTWRRPSVLISLAFLLGLLNCLALAAAEVEIQVAEGLTVELFATGVPFAGDLSFGPSGDLFVGNEGDGIMPIHRVKPNGEVSPFGSPTFDPDIVLALASGDVLVGGRGIIHRISADDQATTIFSDSGAIGNVGDLIGQAGEILVANFNRDTLIRLDAKGAFLETVSEVRRPLGLAEEVDGSLFAIAFVDGAIVHVGSDGEILDPEVVEGLEGPSQLAWGPGGAFGNGLFIIETHAGTVSALNADGTKTVVASGFPRPVGIAFGPDGLYVSDFTTERIYRIGPEAAPCREEDFESGNIGDGWFLEGIGNANQESATITDIDGDHVLALTADGATAYLGSDNAGFLYRHLSGDFRFEASLDSEPMITGKAWRKAGLMVRASLDHLDVRLLAMLAPVQRRLQFVARETYGGPGNIKVGLEVPEAPSSLRLAIERTGQTLTVSYSLNHGLTWLTPATGLGGSIEIEALPEDLLVGLAMVSNNISVTSTAYFDDVRVCPAD